MLTHLIVDGYNVLYAWKRAVLKDGPFPDAIAVARETLLRDLELAAATRGVHCTVVFDGQPIEDVTHASSQHLEVLFAGPRQSADTVIERLVCQSRNRGPRDGTRNCSRRELFLEVPSPKVPPASRLIVVTDDRLLGTLVVGWGARCWSTALLARWLEGETA